MAGRPWIRAYTELLMHPKFIALSDPAQARLFRLWLYCGLYETDGVITQKASQSVDVSARNRRTLVEKGWLLEVGDHWVVKDWLDHQPDSETVHRKRELTRERVRKHRSKRNAGNAPRNAPGNAQVTPTELEVEGKALQALPLPVAPPTAGNAGDGAAAESEALPPQPPEADYTPPSDEEIDAALSPELQAARRRGRVAGKAEQTRREQRAEMDAAALNGKPITEEAARASVEFLRRKVEMEDA